MARFTSVQTASNFDALSKDEKEKYISQARNIIYPDLRPGYTYHEKMISLISRALFKADKLRGSNADYIYSDGKEIPWTEKYETGL